MAKSKALPTEGSEHWQEYRNVIYVKAVLDDESNEYTVVGQRGDVWTVPADEFHTYYKPVTPNKS